MILKAYHFPKSLLIFLILSSILAIQAWEEKQTWW